MRLSERDRIQAVQSFHILDTGCEPAYDDAVGLLARACDVPYALLMFFGENRSWCKATYGLPRTHAVGCAEGIAAFETESIIVCADVDTATDDPWAETCRAGCRIRSYAAARIVGRDGLVVGAITIATGERHAFTSRQLRDLKTSAGQIAAQLELRREDLRRHRVTPTSKALELDDPARLRRAMEREEFLLYYQPIVSLPTREIIGVEALLRWQHPELGLVGPDCFLPLLESSELMPAVGRWVRERAVLDVARLQRRSGTALSLSINVSGREFDRPGFAASVEDLLYTTGVDAPALIFELTESARVDNLDIAARELERVRRLASAVVIDDYGTGYAGLQLLLDLPVTGIKIERMFTARLAETRVQSALTKLLDFCSAGGLTSVLEGVETSSECDIANDLGFSYAQGYLFSRPVPIDALDRLVRRGEEVAAAC